MHEDFFSMFADLLNILFLYENIFLKHNLNAKSLNASNFKCDLVCKNCHKTAFQSLQKVKMMKTRCKNRNCSKSCRVPKTPHLLFNSHCQWLINPSKQIHRAHFIKLPTEMLIGIASSQCKRLEPIYQSLKSAILQCNLKSDSSYPISVMHRSPRMALRRLCTSKMHCTFVSETLRAKTSRLYDVWHR